MSARPLAGLKVLEFSHTVMGPTCGLVFADLGADVIKVEPAPRRGYRALQGYLAGPYEHRPALDEVVQFQVGLAYMTGPPGRPLRAGASIIDILGAVFGVVAVQAALRERETSGKGQRVSSALF